MDKVKETIKEMLFVEFSTPSTLKIFLIKIVVFSQESEVNVIYKKGPVSTVEVDAPPPNKYNPEGPKEIRLGEVRKVDLLLRVALP